MIGKIPLGVAGFTEARFFLKSWKIWNNLEETQEMERYHDEVMGKCSKFPENLEEIVEKSWLNF